MASKTQRIELLTVWAGPNGVVPAGAVRTVSAETAAVLIKNRQAKAVVVETRTVKQAAKKQHAKKEPAKKED